LHGFEIFAEQQIVQLNEAYKGKVDPYNNTYFGSTHVDDFWTKIDITYSPMDGWPLYRHVRLGCFLVPWQYANPASFTTKEDPLMTDKDCHDMSNKTQAFFRIPD
jgi:hypothetical protein